MPILAHEFAQELQHVDLRRILAGGLDDEVEGAAVGEAARTLLAVAREAEAVQQPVGGGEVVLGPRRRVLRLEQRTSRQDGVLPGLGEAEVDDLAHLGPVDGQRQRPAEVGLAHQLAPGRVVVVQVGEQRDLGATRRPPQPDGEAVALLALLQHGEILEAQAPGLEVDVARRRLHRDQPGAHHRERDLVDVGKLPALGIDPVVEWVADEDEPGRRRRRLQDPGVEARQGWVVVLIRAGLAQEQRGPVALALVLHHLVEGRLIGVLGMERLQVAGGEVDVLRPRPGQCGQEVVVGDVPAVADGDGVNDLDLRRLVAGEQELRRPARRQLRMVGDVLPEEAEVLGGEGLAVGPLVAAPQMEGEDAVVLDLVALDDIRAQCPALVVADQPGVAVDHHHPGVLGHARQHAQAAAIAAGLQPQFAERHDQRRLRQPVGHGRQLALGDAGGEHRWFRGGAGCERQKKGGQCRQQPRFGRHTRSLLAGPGWLWARTKCPSPRSNNSGGPSPLALNGGGHAEGVEARPSMSMSKSSLRPGSG